MTLINVSPAHTLASLLDLARAGLLPLTTVAIRECAASQGPLIGMRWMLRRVPGSIFIGALALLPVGLTVLTASALDERIATAMPNFTSSPANKCIVHFALPTGGFVQAIRRFVEAKLPELNPATIGHCIRMLSTFFTDLVERGLAEKNPVRAVPRSTRALYKPTTDPRSTPFIEKLDDVRRLFQALPAPINVAFGVGAFGGLRTGEVLGLGWQDIDLVSRRITVRQQVNEGELTTLKDDESRLVPIQDALLAILTEYEKTSGGEGLLFRPGWKGKNGGGGTAKTKPVFMRSHTLHRHLKLAFKACKLKPLTWYHSTRHTFASQWVIAGGSMEKLSVILGHSSVVVTQRYAHLRVDHFHEADYRMLAVDLAQKDAVVAQPVSAPIGYAGATIPKNAIPWKQLDATHAPLKNSSTRL